MNKNFCLWLKLKTSVFDTSFENKTLSEELQDYKVKSVFETERLWDTIWREGLQDYKSLSKGESERAILDLNFEPLFWTLKLDMSSVFGVCLL